jgi:hypothetical protein
MEGKWTEGRFYTLVSKQGDPGDPVIKATITQPGSNSAIELLIAVADFPLIGAPFSEDEMEKAKEIGSFIVDRFWPSEEAVRAIVMVIAETEREPVNYEEGPE